MPRNAREDRPRPVGDDPGAKNTRPYRPTADDQRGKRPARRDERAASSRPSSSDRPTGQRSGAAAPDRRRDGRDSSWEDRRPRSQDGDRRRYEKPSSYSSGERPRYDQPRREERPRPERSDGPRGRTSERPARDDNRSSAGRGGRTGGSRDDSRDRQGFTPREDRAGRDDRPRRDDRASRPSGSPRDDRSPRDARSSRHSSGSRDDRTSRPTGGAREDRGRPTSHGEDRRNTRPGQESRADRPFEPRIPEGVTGRELDKPLREELRGLSKETAERVAQHLVAAFLLEDTDTETSQAHARFAARIGGRVGGVRETYGILAYRAGDYRTAVRELRTSLRITGRADVLPMIADAERGMGRPERALDMAASDEATSLGVVAAIELMIVVAGAYADTGDVQTALRTLEIPALRHKVDGRWQVRLWAAYADLLERAERPDEAKRWLTLAADADTEGLTDAAERLGRPGPQVEQEPTWEDDEQVSVLDAYDPNADDLAAADADSDSRGEDDDEDAAPDQVHHGSEDAAELEDTEIDGSQDDAEASDVEADGTDVIDADQPELDESDAHEEPDERDVPEERDEFFDGHEDDQYTGGDQNSEELLRHDDQQAVVTDEDLLTVSPDSRSEDHA